MGSDAPPFWYEKPGLQSALTSPIAWIYGMIATRLMKNAKREKISLPVVCIGNFTVGGTGKTPTAIAVAQGAIAKGLTPGFLTRGYGGSVVEPTLVDIEHHSARYVGDEPLLLAQQAKTVVASDRVAGAKMLVDEGVDIIIMDDGFQSAQLWFDLSIMVVDANRGLGNGKVIPAGPVRAPLKEQMLFADMLAVIGKGTAADSLIRIAARSAKPVYTALTKAKQPDSFKGKSYLAFAAIGDPDKFFRSLKEAGAIVEIEKSFPDHHYYSDDEMNELLSLAEKSNLKLVTTEKDFVRLNSSIGTSKQFAEKIQSFEIYTHFDDPKTGQIVVDQAITRFKKRKIK